MDYDVVIDDLWWKYKTSEDWVLRNISLKIGRGEFLGVVGPSGAGKSTLCLCMTGLIPQLSKGTIKGGVSIKGLDSSLTPLSSLIRKVGIVFQDPETQFVTMSVEDEVAFPMENFAFPRDEMVKRVQAALELTRMTEFRDKYPYELSGGQKQRVAIASFLALRPEILILDEPTSDLDPVGKSEVFSVLAELKKTFNTTLIVVEHNTEELSKYADNIVFLYDGEVWRQGPPSEFFSDILPLKKRGVYPPQVTEFFHLLSKDEGIKRKIPITLDEATRLFSETFKVSGVYEVPVRGFVEGEKSMKGERIVDMRRVRFAYPDGTLALDGIDLSINKGEYIAIIGQNGSGKTTLVKHLVGLLKPTEGDVEVFGSNTRDLSVANLATNVGYIYQNPDHQLFCSTVFEECAYGLRNLHLPESDIKKRVGKVLETMGLTGLETTEPFVLGKGQRQRIAIAATLAMMPDIIIIDEPTTGQDMKQSKAVMKLLDTLNERGKTIIIITHNMRLVAEHARRVIVLAQGKILLDASVRKVFSEFETLNRTFLTPPQITRFARRISSKLPTVLSVDEMQICIANSSRKKNLK